MIISNKNKQNGNTFNNLISASESNLRDSISQVIYVNIVMVELFDIV